MQTKYFSTTTNEYCHISDDTIFIFNSKVPTRIPLEDELSNAWSVKSILNYFVFAFLFLYTMASVSYYGFYFFKQPLNYAGILLLFLSFIRMKEGFVSSNTPSIRRNTIKSVHFKTPMFSFPRVVIYFVSHEGKTLRRTISVKNKNEAISVLKEEGLV